MSLPAEAELIERLRVHLESARRRHGAPRSEAMIGIGDDAAVIGSHPQLVVSSDMLLDGVDFPPGSPPSAFAIKSLVANVSDTRAMGAEPCYAVVALGLPVETEPAAVEEFFAALADGAARLRLEVIGGDLSEAPVWTISITILGQPSGRVWTRSGARPGDSVWYLGGSLGAAAAGLRLLFDGGRLESEAPPGWPPLDEHEQGLATEAMRAQLFPSLPDLPSGAEITAAIDVSDGLLLDTHRLASASGVAVEIEVDSIPVFRLGPALERHLGRSPLSDAMSGGEDFGLLLTSSVDHVQGALRIGDVRAGSGVQLRENGTLREALPAGHQHFSESGKC